MDRALEGRLNGPPPIRAARLADLPALQALEAAAFATDRLSRRAMRHHLAAPASVFLVADAGGGPAGYALVSCWSRSLAARLSSLAVAPSQAGRGIGAALLLAAEDAATARGFGAIRLEVRADNLPAQRLYARAGYERTGERRGYYEDGQTAVLLRRMLAPQTG